MADSTFEEMKAYVGFTADDAQNVCSLYGAVAPAFPRIVDRFYDELMRHEGARAVLRGADQIARLRQTLLDWLVSLFGGTYDQAYFDARLRIGLIHVRVGLPQRYMLTGMELIWQELEHAARRSDPPDFDEKLRSLHKLVMLDLAAMLLSYTEHYSEQARASERSAVEEKLTRAEHLAEIGQLAASLAHEIKNPLAGISGAIQIIRDALPEAHEHRTIINEILAQIRRLDATVKDLMQYAKPLPPQREWISLERMVARVLGILKEEPALRRVRVACDPSGSRARVFADDRQIEQLLMNLLLNAAQASAAGDRVRVSIRDRDERVELGIRDSGSGMDAKGMQRAFEPFFTTKAKGTGLGLPICRRIVEAHGGTIALESDVNKGTTVTVCLPIKGPDANGEAPA